VSASRSATTRARTLPWIPLSQSAGGCRLLPPLRSVSSISRRSRPRPGATPRSGTSTSPTRPPGRACQGQTPPGPVPRGRSHGPGAARPAAPAPAPDGSPRPPLPAPDRRAGHLRARPGAPAPASRPPPGTANRGHASGQATGAAAQPQQRHRGRSAVAAIPELAAITHQPKVLRQEAVAAAAPLGLGQKAGSPGRPGLWPLSG
jgi:hypothetical protein